jgi:hypothetical protein
VERWRLDRRDGALEVDIDASAIEHDDADAIVDASPSEPSDAVFDSIHATGGFLDAPRPGTKGLLRRLGMVARRYGKRFGVGPI